MPKNKIQVQKGSSLPKFLEKYGGEEQCQGQLFRLRWSKGYLCPRCHSSHYTKLNTKPLYQCKKCKFQSNLTSNTIFASTTRPLAVWFPAIYHLTRRNKGISSLYLAQSLGISSIAALWLKHKLQLVVKDKCDAHPLPGNIQLDDGYPPIYMRLSRLALLSTKKIRSWSLCYFHNASIVVSHGMPGFVRIVRLGFT